MLTNHAIAISNSSILVVDDTHADLRFLIELLSEQGYRVRPVSDGRLALSSAQAEPPDLILLDILMPGLSGYEVCAQLKADRRTCDIPVIFTSALSEILDKVKAFSVGGVDYIAKPFQGEEVLARIETHLTLRNLQKDLQQKNVRLQQEILDRERAETSLKESEERYRRLVELSPEAIMVRQGGKFVYANAAAVKLFAARNAEELVGRSIMDFIDPAYLEMVRQQVKKIFEERKLTPLTEQRLIRLDGQAIDVEIAGAPITYQGEPATQVVIRDVTDRKQTQKFLRESEKRYRSIFENAPIGIFQMTLDGRFLTANSALAWILGYASVRDLIRTITNVAEQVYVEPQDWDDITNLVHSSQEPVKAENRCRCKDGREILINLNIWAVRDERGEAMYYEGFLEDITERKQMEAALLKERNLLRTLINSTPDLVYVKDREHRFLLANDAVLRSMGLSLVEQLLGKTDFDMYPAKLAKQYYTDEEAILKTGQSLINKEEPFIDQQTKTTRWSLTTKVPLRDDQGTIIGLVGINHDITKRKRSEEVLFKQATLLRSVAKAMTCLLVKTDFRSAIAQAIEILGVATEVDRIYIFENHPHPTTGAILMSQRFEWIKNKAEAQSENPDLQNMPYHPRFTRWYEILQTNKAISGLVREFPQPERTFLEAQHILSIIVVPIMIQDRLWGFIGFDAYQTERQWREEEESILFAMAGSIGGVIASQQTAVELMAANKELQETLDDLQRTQSQLILSGKMAALGQLIAGIAHEINTPLGAIRSSIKNMTVTLEQVLEHLPTFFQTLSAERQNEFLALLQRTLHKDVMLSASEERRFKRALVETLKESHPDHALKIADILVNMGIYENIQPFLPLLRDPDYPRILNMAYQLSGLQEGAQIITTATDRASKVVFALKTFARHDQSEAMVETNLTEGIEMVLTLHHNQYKHGVEVVRQYEPLQAVFCYPDELNQVWENLIHNALQAMDYKGKLTIAVCKQDNHALVTISDTGKGIPDAIKHKIFEPFFTTKPAGEGSGLGLNIVKKIIEKHRGTITFESQPGKTTFYVSLPIRRTMSSNGSIFQKTK